MTKLLCMEVGTSIVRLAEVVKRGKTVEITKTFVFDTPDDATKDGKVRVSDEVVSAIRDGLDESGIKALDVYFAVESPKILFKQVELPLVQKRLIRSTLELAFSDIFPVDETLYHLSYVFKRSYEKNGQKMMILDVFAIPNDLSESYYNLSVALGLNARGLSDTSHSIMSLFAPSFQNRNIAMVNINENSSSLTVAVDGDMVFKKTITFGVSDAIKHIVNSPLTLDKTDVTGASELLYSQNVLMRQIPKGGIGESEEEKLRYQVTTSLMPLVKTIESTFTSFLSKERIQIQEFQLSGLGAGFAGISQLFTSEFGIPVTIVQNEGNLKVHKNAADDTLLLSCYPCVGSVLDQTNFFTVEEQAGGEVAQRKRIDKIFVYGGVIACVAAFCYGSYSWLQSSLAYQDAYDENVQLTKRVQELRELGVESAYNKYSSASSYYEEVKKLYQETGSGNEEMTVFLEELEQLLPVTARITSITLSPKTANVSVVCNDKFVAAGVLHLMRNMQTVHTMDCPGVSESGQTGEVSFQCSFQLKSTAGRGEQSSSQNDIAEGGN